MEANQIETLPQVRKDGTKTFFRGLSPDREVFEVQAAVRAGYTTKGQIPFVVMDGSGTTAITVTLAPIYPGQLNTLEKRAIAAGLAVKVQYTGLALIGGTKFDEDGGETVAVFRHLA